MQTSQLVLAFFRYYLACGFVRAGCSQAVLPSCVRYVFVIKFSGIDCQPQGDLSGVLSPTLGPHPRHTQWRP